MSYSKDLYCNGFINLSFSKEDSIKKLHSTINNMNSENIKEDFFWESKYPNTPITTQSTN